MAFFIPAIQFFFGLPRALLCFGINFNAILGSLSSVILWTWPYHVSWFCSVSFIIVSSSPVHQTHSNNTHQLYNKGAETNTHTTNIQTQNNNKNWYGGVKYFRTPRISIKGKDSSDIKSVATRWLQKFDHRHSWNVFLGLPNQSSYGQLLILIDDGPSGDRHHALHPVRRSGRRTAVPLSALNACNARSWDTR